jgi:hypothetical protein
MTVYADEWRHRALAGRIAARRSQAWRQAMRQTMSARPAGGVAQDE